MQELIPTIESPELFVGFVAPIGAPIDDVMDEFDKRLTRRGYDVHRIKISDQFERISNAIGGLDTRHKDQYERYKKYIRIGDRAREVLGHKAILAAGAVKEVIKTRRADGDPTKKAYLFSQFKRPEEISMMRSVYGFNFFQVSIYSRRTNRARLLSDKFARDEVSGNSHDFLPQAWELIQMDENESQVESGQRVAKIFHDADFIVDADETDKSISSQVKRFSELLFGANFHSPTLAEYGMYIAHSAALRTTDLSRQVGAAVFTKHGEVIALGSNEVPKAGGGSYWSDGDFDDREFRRKQDSNEIRKRHLTDDMLKRAGTSRAKLSDEQLKAIADSGFMDALEYGRIVHAEMSALTDAARTGRPVKSSNMYVTTFPCHMCAKHIVAAGIDKVVFLEPYPKSLASDLHSDAIDIEGGNRGKYNSYPSVRFEHFYGVTPRRYQLLFKRKSRKDENGSFEEFRGNIARPLIDIHTPAYINNETLVAKEYEKAIQGIE